MDQNGIAAYKLSKALGFGKNYFTKLLAGESLPKLRDFFRICEYFGITPEEFFDDRLKYPQKAKKLQGMIGELGSEELDMIMPIVERLSQKTV